MGALNSGSVIAEMTASLAPTSVLPDQPVILTLTQSGPAGPMPDLGPLQQDFQITNRSTRNEVSLVNGTRRERRQLRLTLLPRRTGTLTVPRLRAGDDATEPMEVIVGATTTVNSSLLAPPTGVTTPQPNPSPPLPISIDVHAEPGRVHVRQQIVLTARVTASGAAPMGRLHGPLIVGARVLPLGEDRRSEAAEDASGVIHIYERRFAVFPNEPGPLSIPPLRFDAWNTAGGGPVPHLSDALQVQVDPIPAGVGERPWLPARSITLTEAGPTAVRIAPGQALERMITLRGDGLMAEDLPMIPLAIPFQLRIRDDAPRLWNERSPDGVIGYRSERILIGAAEEGDYKLTGTVLEWWNTQTRDWQQAALPPWMLTVASFASEDRRPAATWNRALPAPGASAASPETSSPSPSAGLLRMLWGYSRAHWQPWIGITAAAVGLILLGWLVQRRTRGRTNPEPEPEPGIADAVDKLPGKPADASAAAVERAYRSANAPAARQALLDWGKVVWPESAPANLAQLAMRVEPPLRNDIRLLEKAFFSPTPIDWTEPPVWERLGDAERAAIDEPGEKPGDKPSAPAIAPGDQTVA